MPPPRLKRYGLTAPRDRRQGRIPPTGVLCLTEQMIFCEEQILRYALLYRFRSSGFGKDMPEYMLRQLTSGRLSLHMVMTSPDEIKEQLHASVLLYRGWAAGEPRRYIEPRAYWYAGRELQRKFRVNVCGGGEVLVGSDSAAGYQMGFRIFEENTCWSGTSLFSVVTLNNPKFLNPGQSEDGTKSRS